ncbi:MAG TPA: pyroglutamyl-peptidase I [Stellaceae bacterium]|nr:pyroglutamyl-peptidase I [Stellaceae bacterium]
MKALVTGFEPFAGDPVNPAMEALRLLPPSLGTLTLVTRVLPTSFGGSLEALQDALRATAPDIALGVGLAGGRAALSLERVALKIDDARVPDNDGHQPVDQPVVPGGPAAYFATLPIKAAVVALRQAGLPASVSNSAGTFVCNHLFYGLMHLAATRLPGLRAGFLHVPYLPSQAARYEGAPSMALDDIVRGIAIVLAVAAARRDDIAVAEGAIS